MKALGFFVGESHYRCWFLTQLSPLILEPCQLAWSRLAKFRKSSCSSPRFLQVLIFEVTLDLVSARARSVLFVVISNDFTCGFPVMHALYPPQPHPSEGVSTNMIAYLAINAVLAYVVFVPVTIVLLQLGKSPGGGNSEDESLCERVVNLAKDVLLSPIIVAVIVGVFWQHFGPLVKVNGVLHLPSTIDGIVQLFTSPFGMLALFMTGTSVDNFKLSSG